MTKAEAMVVAVLILAGVLYLRLESISQGEDKYRVGTEAMAWVRGAR